MSALPSPCPHVSLAVACLETSVSGLVVLVARPDCCGSAQSVRRSHQVQTGTHVSHTVTVYHSLVIVMEQDSQRRLSNVSKVWEGVWAGEGSATPRSDSGLNSLEYWDYSVELECITGQQGDTQYSLPGQGWVSAIFIFIFWWSSAVENHNKRYLVTTDNSNNGRTLSSRCHNNSVTHISDLPSSLPPLNIPHLKSQIIWFDQCSPSVKSVKTPVILCNYVTPLIFDISVALSYGFKAR